MQNQATLLASIAHQAMIDRGLEPDFSREAEQQLTKIDAPANENSSAIRDLRNLLWCSIDNDDSRDLDQLTVAEDKGKGDVRRGVAVGDGGGGGGLCTPIDDHAERNTTSI